MRPGDRRRAVLGRRLGRVAGVGGDDDRVVQERRAAVTLANFAENSPKVRCSARSRDQPERRRRPRTRSCRRCRGRPRSRRAARTARAGPRARADDVLDRLLAVRGAHERRAVAARCVELLGADLRRAAAEAAVGGLEVGGDLECRARRMRRLLGGRIGSVPRRAAAGSPSLPGGRFHPRRQSRRRAASLAPASVRSRTAVRA